MFDSGWCAAAAVAPARPTWSEQAPGPALAAALAASAPVDVVDDEGFDAVERLAAWEALAAWTQARLHQEIADYLHARQGRVRGEGRGELASQSVAMEVATVGRVAARTGEIRVHQADMLVERLPGTLAALDAGRISLSHARVVIEQTEQCSAETARTLDATLWSRPPRDRTPTQLRETVRRLLARLDPDALRRRPEQARRDRELRYWSDDDGATGVIQMRMPADQARGVYAVVDATARAAGDPPTGEQRTLAQRRLDAARDLILDGATARGNAACSACSGCSGCSGCPASDDDDECSAPTDDGTVGSAAAGGRLGSSGHADLR